MHMSRLEHSLPASPSLLEDVRAEFHRKRREAADVVEFIGRHPECKRDLPDILRTLQSGDAPDLESARQVVQKRLKK
jgi:hypothetical protein